MTADIASMFNQVMVPVRDRDALRFLTECVLICLGSLVSKCSYICTSRVTDDPVIKNIVLNSFYVDDCIISTRSTERVKKNITDLKHFHLVGSILPSSQVMMKKTYNPECDRFDNQDIMVSPDSNHKVLGVGWSVNTDSFYFDVHVDVNRSSWTKSQMLSIVAAIFYPLGLMAPITVTGMMLFQQANKLKINWRQELPKELQAKWIAWLITLDAISSLKIPRCIKPHRFDDNHVELHAFCDASQRAYGCCFYMRSINRHGEIHIALVCGKSRLAPIKTVSIPRLELQAACLAASI